MLPQVRGPQAQHLAEAICELAAPRLQPCFIRLQEYTEGGCAALVVAMCTLELGLTPCSGCPDCLCHPQQTSLLLPLPLADAPMQTVLLHVRPRHLAAGLEIAVYSGYVQYADEDEVACAMNTEGTVYAVPRTEAGLERFAADLTAAGPEYWSAYGAWTLAIPLGCSDLDHSWREVALHLLPPTAVRASQMVRGAVGFLPLSVGL